jgi:hypothetical protein
MTEVYDPDTAPCHICGRDHTDPAVKALADLVAEIEREYGDQPGVPAMVAAKKLLEGK